MVITIGTFAQDITVQKDNSTELYQFPHQKNIDPSSVDRIIFRFKTECPELESIQFDNGKCTFKLKNQLTDQEIDKAIKYCISRFGYQQYTISEL